MLEAEIPMFLGIGVAAFIAETGILNSIAHLVQPVVTGWLGLPKEASISLILGVIRRELAVLPLLDMDLNTLQLLVGAVVALFYIPCLSVLGVLVKEFGVRTAILIMIFTIVVAFVLGGIINNIGTLIYMIF
jgi:ferrous iron transport protein B